MEEIEKERSLVLQELNEIRNVVYRNSKIDEAKVKVFHDKRLRRREFNVHKFFWLYNCQLKLFLSKSK